MIPKLAVVAFISILISTPLPAQKRRPRPPAPKPAKTTAARLLVQGTYEEIFDGVTSDGIAKGKLTIKFEIGRWLTMGTNEVGNAEFSDLPNGPTPSVSGFVSYQGTVKGSGVGHSYDALSSFTGGLADNDIIVTTPEYNDTGTGYKVRVFINPKIKGKCSLVSVRGDERFTSSQCPNGTYFFTAAMPIQVEANDDPAKTDDTANIARFGIELDVEPPLGELGNTGSGVDEAARARKELEKLMAQASGAAPGSDDGGYAWRGSVTNGSKEAGFKILLDKTKDIPSEDKRGHISRHLVFEATIIPGIPK